MTQADDQGMVTTIRGEDGASVLGPENVPIGSQNPGAPPRDSGSLPNLKFPFAAAHNRLLPGGWAREVTIRELSVATTRRVRVGRCWYHEPVTAAAPSRTGKGKNNATRYRRARERDTGKSSAQK